MIQASRLTKIYGNPANGVRAIDGLTLNIQPKERVALLGRSGSGKTTLMNMLAGLDRPTSGELIVAGESLFELDATQLAAYRMSRIGVVFQSFQLIPQRTAWQNVELPLILAGVTRTERRTRVAECLDRVGLNKRGKHSPSQLSGGEQQRVAVARAIVAKPPVLLADEPTGNLDSQTATEVANLILEVVAENESTLVLITHDESLAARCSTRTLRMSDGKFIDELSPPPSPPAELTDEAARYLDNGLR